MTRKTTRTLIPSAKWRMRQLAFAATLAFLAVTLAGLPSSASGVIVGNSTNGTNSTVNPYKKDPYYHFNLIFHTLIFVVALWISGKLVVRLGAPALVGEILVGIVLGPNLLNFVPKPSSLQLYGEMGLILLIVEAGIHVDLELLAIVGQRALILGIVGSAVPMSLGFGVCYALGWFSTLECFAVGATMATMSTGIALNVLRAGGVLNQPTGQLIIAAATVNEMVNIFLLTTLEAIVRGATSWVDYVVPALVMVGLVAIIAFLAISAIPRVLDDILLPRIPHEHHHNFVLGLIFAAVLIFMPLCKYTGSSDLLGAFLAGFCFCTDEHVHHTWDRQVKRIMSWLLRLFFACYIGFSIPVLEFADIQTWELSGLLLIGMLTKIGMGLFAPNQNPNVTFDRDQVACLGFAWGAWGEFSFILAQTAKEGQLISTKTYNSIALTVMISILINPLMLRYTLEVMADNAAELIETAKHDTEDAELGYMHPVYYCLQTRSKAGWGQQELLLNSLAKVGCKIIDFRTFHPHDHVGLAHVVNELYIKDLRLSLVLHEELDADDVEKLKGRITEIIGPVKEALGNDEKTEVKMSRWLPGRGHEGGNKAQDADGGRKRQGSAFDRQAEKSVHENLKQFMKKWHSKHDKRHYKALGSMSKSFKARAHHELDGFVHNDAHDAFDTEVEGEEKQGRTRTFSQASGMSSNGYAEMGADEIVREGDEHDYEDEDDGYHHEYDHETESWVVVSERDEHLLESEEMQQGEQNYQAQSPANASTSGNATGSPGVLTTPPGDGRKLSHSSRPGHSKALSLGALSGATAAASLRERGNTRSRKRGSKGVIAGDVAFRSGRRRARSVEQGDVVPLFVSSRSRKKSISFVVSPKASLIEEEMENAISANQSSVDDNAVAIELAAAAQAAAAGGDKVVAANDAVPASAGGEEATEEAIATDNVAIEVAGGAKPSISKMSSADSEHL